MINMKEINNEIPKDIWVSAKEVANYFGENTLGYDLILDAAARAILAERIKRDNEIDSLKKVITGIINEPRVDVQTDCYMGVYIYEEAVLVTSDAFRYAVRRMEEYKK